MIRLVALDLDGTFYAGRILGVPDSAWAAIERGKREGLRFAVCTGRPQGGFGLEWGRRIEPDGPHVFNDGASICTAEGQPLYAAPLPHLRELVGLARNHGLCFDLNTATGGRYYEPELMPPGILEHVAMVGVEARSRRLEELDLAQEPPVRLWYVVPDLGLWESVRPELTALPGLDLAEYFSPREIIAGVIRQGISKATGLRWLAAYYGLHLSEIAMIGDSDNDVSAIRDAGLGIAMGNAIEPVKAVADHIVGHVREGGFAEAVEYVLEKNR
ncbi:MAG: Cof-type HAD-IIB family hydrolase [Thermaceae bacterium]|nr:Cof-type HAD-IIB family hydrolase [Thermaceae bacterium]